MHSQVQCPHCQATMKSNKPLPQGKAIRCLKCRGQFTIRQPDPDTLISVPFQGPPRRSSPLITWLFLGGLLILLASGVILGVYCLSLSNNAKLAKNNEGDSNNEFELPDPEDDN